MPYDVDSAAIQAYRVLNKHQRIRMRILPLAFLWMVVLSSCGRESNEVERERSISSPVLLIEVDNIDAVGSDLSRNDLLQSLIQLNNTRFQSEMPVDRNLMLAIEASSTANFLNLLLDDLSYSASFKLDDDGRAWLSDLSIHSQVELSLGAEFVSPESTESVAVAEAINLETQLLLDAVGESRVADAEALVGELLLSPENLAVFEQLLVQPASTDSERQTQAAIMRRLDLSTEFGAKQLTLKALSSSDEQIVLQALDSIDIWYDPSIANWLVPLQSHPDAYIRSRAQTMREDLSAYSQPADLPEGTKLEPSALKDLLPR